MTLFGAFFNAIQLVFPEAFKLAGPLMERPDGFGVRAVEHAAAVAAYVNEVGFEQDTQMLGDRRLFEAQVRRNFADRVFPQGEVVQDFPAARLGNGIEDVGNNRGARHEARIHSHMGICQEELCGPDLRADCEAREDVRIRPGELDLASDSEGRDAGDVCRRG